MTGVGGVLVIAATGLAAARGYDAIMGWAPPLAFGVLHLAVGAPLWAAGAGRARHYREWRSRCDVALAPATGRGQRGASASFTMRF